MIFCYKFNFQLIKRKPLLSKIEQVEMLIALGKGDKYRLMNIRQSLESDKELFISDKDFLQDLIKTHLGDKIYQARVVSISEKPNLFCEECGSEISADEKFCTNCGTEKLEPETKQEAGSGEQQASGGFAFTADGDIGESSTRETAQRKPKSEPKKKSRQQELEEYEKKYLNESETKARQKVKKSKTRTKAKKEQTAPAEKTKALQKVKKSKTRTKAKKEPATSAEKPKGSQKTEPEVFSRYYRSPEDESLKVKKSKSKKPNPFCEECGSKIPAKDMFCTNCGAKR